VVLKGKNIMFKSTHSSLHSESKTALSVLRHFSNKLTYRIETGDSRNEKMTVEIQTTFFYQDSISGGVKQFKILL